MIIDPRGYEFEEWADYTADELTDLGPAVHVIPGQSWKAWASAVLEVPGIASLNPPRPEGFADWRTWADRFNQVMDLR